MNAVPGLADLMREAREIRDSIGVADNERSRRFEAIEASINDLFRKVGRPSFGGGDNSDGVERKEAIGLCLNRRNLIIPKNDGSGTDYVPSSAEIDEALLARKALRSLFRHGDNSRLDVAEKKSLSSFSFGNNGFILAPEMSNRVLSCLVDQTDIAGLMDNVTISGASIKFLIDNVTMQDAAWACETQCFANNPQPNLQDGLGELEIKAETLRMIVCANSDLLQDASFNIEAWVLRKVERGFRNTINGAIVMGDGVGKPLGILHPNSGVPVCETSASTAAGAFSWQDLIMLKWQVPMQYHSQGDAFLMNQNTFALLLTMSDASGRPIMVDNPTQRGQFLLNGSPVVIATQMPDVFPAPRRSRMGIGARLTWS